jgi:hypothetical protein
MVMMSILILYIPNDRKNTWNKIDVTIDEVIDFWNNN